MGIEQSLFAVLGPLASGRAYPDTFPQDVKWPAIRYVFVSAIPGVTVCGNGDDKTTDIRVQIDAVTRTDIERDALRIAIWDAMALFSPPAVCISWEKGYDPDTRGYRARLDYLIQPSSAADPP